jgi:hypothetical protein
MNVEDPGLHELAEAKSRETVFTKTGFSATTALRKEIFLARFQWNNIGDIHNLKIAWRRGRDSNPRDPFGPNGFQDRRIKPLSHPSRLQFNCLASEFQQAT